MPLKPYIRAYILLFWFAATAVPKAYGNDESVNLNLDNLLVFK